MRETCSFGSVGEPLGNHRLYPERGAEGKGSPIANGRQPKKGKE
jgi:hypothetical protein